MRKFYYFALSTIYFYNKTQGSEAHSFRGLASMTIMSGSRAEMTLKPWLSAHVL